MKVIVYSEGLRNLKGKWITSFRNYYCVVREVIADFSIQTLVEMFLRFSQTFSEIKKKISQIFCWFWDIDEKVAASTYCQLKSFEYF